MKTPEQASHSQKKERKTLYCNLLLPNLAYFLPWMTLDVYLVSNFNYSLCVCVCFQLDLVPWSVRPSVTTNNCKVVKL